jgi:hypothetical protein
MSSRLSGILAQIRAPWPPPRGSPLDTGITASDDVRVTRKGDRSIVRGGVSESPSGLRAESDLPRTVISPAPRDAWDELVRTNRAVLVSQTPQWLDAICASGRYEDASRLYQAADGTKIVLPLVRRTGPARLLLTELSLAPTWGSGGLVTARSLRSSDITAVFADLSTRAVVRTTVRPDFLQAPTWAAAGHPAGVVTFPITHHVLDLSPEFSDIHRNFSKMARKAIRKAEREGVTIDSAPGGHNILTYQGLYERWVEHRARERGLPLPLARLVGIPRRERIGVSLASSPPLERLHLLSRLLGSVFRVWVASVGGIPVAAMITLIRGDVAIAWRATSDPARAGPVRAMDLLHRYAIEFACREGCRYYNFGESGGVESLMRFKMRFGATPRTFSGYRIERIPITPVTRRLAVIKPVVENLVLQAARRRTHATTPHADRTAD